MPIHHAPLVGSHFRPPAKALLASLPAGFHLELRPEPLNPYDPNAIEVWLDTHHVDAGTESGERLEETSILGTFLIGHLAIKVFGLRGAGRLRSDPDLLIPACPNQRSHRVQHDGRHNVWHDAQQHFFKLFHFYPFAK